MTRKVMLTLASLASVLGMALATPASAGATTTHNIKLTVFFQGGDILNADCNRHTSGGNLDSWSGCINRVTTHEPALGSVSRPHQYLVTPPGTGIVAEGCAASITHVGQTGMMHFTVHNAIRTQQTCGA